MAQFTYNPDTTDFGSKPSIGEDKDFTAYYM